MSPSTRKVDAKFLAFEKNKFANYPGLAFAAEHKKNHDLHGFYQICT